MIIPDVNVLLYAVNSSAQHHEASKTWLEQALNGHETIGFDWVVLLGFLRISTHRSILPSAFTIQEAWDVMDGWLRQPLAATITPRPSHALLMRRYSEQTGTGGNLTTDAHIAAMAVAHQARICSFDRDLERFDEVERIEP